MSVFITGTDTGVGKTHTAVQILRLLRSSGVRCAGMKPICCGDRDDAQQLWQASTEGFTIDQINPVWLKTPAAPLTASLAEHVNIDILQIRSAFEALRRSVECIVVEGVGGWLVPIRADYFVSDLAAELKLPVLIVVRNKLGCLNHTALTVRSVREHELPLAGIVMTTGEEADDVAAKTNGEMIRQLFSEVPLLPGLSEAGSQFPVDWQPVLGAKTNAATCH